MICCDLCGKAAPCLQKEIEGKEFDICEACWRPLAEKLTGKGRLRECFAELEEYVETTV
jgi:hypothetical protein